MGRRSLTPSKRASDDDVVPPPFKVHRAGPNLPLVPQDAAGHKVMPSLLEHSTSASASASTTGSHGRWIMLETTRRQQCRAPVSGTDLSMVRVRMLDWLPELWEREGLLPRIDDLMLRIRGTQGRQALRYWQQ
ncbi:uncharacterized protein UV8b_05677 [Ustilaginoidea virens]|uniref:Uncharacterized protein n=1 Tax=Ustilaginoidea virens TaxID=1159556 RepID=A0A8E5HUD7_USTVR|nr:uncharacterized protein UV8b_05677 [Ustilaginoidea virens]QUC21434.1 hypothetical protein UV8b_05677 [Ustilaginoidea virens]